MNNSNLIKSGPLRIEHPTSVLSILNIVHSKNGSGDKELQKTRLITDERYTNISLWCLWLATLLIGNPIEKLDKFTLRILLNDEVIEIDQDPLGRQAYLADKDGEGEAWVKSMENGSIAVGLFNRSTK